MRGGHDFLQILVPFDALEIVVAAENSGVAFTNLLAAVSTADLGSLLADSIGTLFAPNDMAFEQFAMVIVNILKQYACVLADTGLLVSEC